MNYIYSIIIPHYNIPELLVRCLKSIPVREDIQVIVVDDCSPDADTYKERFQEFSRPYLEWYSTPIGGSAGRARNIGLQHAKGKWLIFLDSDDMLVDGVESILNEVQNRTEDIIYFDTISVMSNDLTKLSNRNFYHQYFEQYQIDKDERPFRYRFHSLWGKVFQNTFIRKYNIRFDQTRYSNDVMFALKVSCTSVRIKVVDVQLYCVYESDGSLTRNTNWKNYYIRTIVALDALKYIKSQKRNFEYSYWKGWYSNLLRTNKLVAVCLALRICRVAGIKEFVKFLYDRFKTDYPKYYIKFRNIGNIFRS